MNDILLKLLIAASNQNIPIHDVLIEHDGKVWGFKDGRPQKEDHLIALASRTIMDVHGNPPLNWP